MAIDYNDIDRHVKDISSYQFTVFIDEPIKLERVISSLPYYAQQDISVSYKHSSGLSLNSLGYCLAKRALDSLQEKASFIAAHKDEFEGFLASFHKQHEMLSELVQEARLQTQKARMAADWHTQPGLFRKQMELDKKLESLYREMFMTRFGKDAVFLSEDALKDIISH